MGTIVGDSRLTMIENCLEVCEWPAGLLYTQFVKDTTARLLNF